MGKFNTLTQREVLNPETGKVTTIETSKTFTTKVTQDSFYMTFVKFIAPYYKLKSENAQKLLVWLCEHAQFNTGIVLLPTEVRRQITAELNLQNNAITNNLKKLKDFNLISGSNGSFTINPQIFWKGDLKVREQLLKTEDIIINFGIGKNND